MGDHISYKHILNNPAAAFATPADVALDHRFNNAQKIEILRRWAYDAAELNVATEEGMPDGDSPLLQQIMQALSRLGVEIDTEHSPPTKQGGLDRASIRRRN